MAFTLSIPPERKDIRDEPEYQELRASLASMSKERREMLTMALEDLRIIETKGFVTTEQAAKILHLSNPSIRVWIRQGKIKAQRFGGRWRIPCEEINRLLTVNS